MGTIKGRIKQKKKHGRPVRFLRLDNALLSGTALRMYHPQASSAHTKVAINNVSRPRNTDTVAGKSTDVQPNGLRDGWQLHYIQQVSSVAHTVMYRG